MSSVLWTPRPWQTPAVEFVMFNERCNVFMGMGAGKTSASFVALDALSSMADVYPVLVVAPKRVATSVWPYEVKKWTNISHVRVSPIVGTMAQRLSALTFKADVYTINYENLPWLIEYLGNVWPFRTVICDESTRLKSFRPRQGGKRAKSLARRAFNTTRWVNLTGTPCPNGLQDLWGPQWFIDKGVSLGETYTRFKEMWFRTGYDGYSMEPIEGAFDAITKAISSTTVSIELKDYMDIKEPMRVQVDALLPPEILKKYEVLERQLWFELKAGIITAANAADKTMKCLQFASGAVYDEFKIAQLVHNEKLAALDSIIAESGGEPILVAYHFKSDLARLKEYYPHAVELDAKKATEDRWNEGKIPMLLAHPQSAGHGLNLQYGGRRIVFFSHWWSLENRLQIIERLGPVRQMQAGFNRLVYIYDIVASGTMDETVLARHGSKTDVQDAVKQRLRAKGYQI